MRPDSARRSTGQRSRPPAPPSSPPPDYMVTSIPIPFYPSSLRPPANQLRQSPDPAPIPPAPTPALLSPVPPVRPRQATRAHVKIRQRFALPAELKAVLQGMTPPERPRFIVPTRRSFSEKEDKCGDRKRRRPASLPVLHPPVSVSQCSAVPPEMGYLENAMARLSLDLHDFQQELRTQHHYAPATAPLSCCMATAPSYRVLSTAAASLPIPERKGVMKRCVNDNSGNNGSCSNNSNNNSDSTQRSRRNGGPRFTVRTADGTEVVLDNRGVDSRMVEILVGDLTGVYCTGSQTYNVPRLSTPSPLGKAAACTATTQDVCTSQSMSLLPTQASDATSETEDGSVASAASSGWFQKQGVLQQHAPPMFSSSPSLKVETRFGTDEVDDENHDDNHGDAFSSPVAESTSLSLASLPIEWPVPAPSPLPSQSPHSQSPHGFSSPESCFSPFVPEGRSVENEREKVTVEEEEQNQDQGQETSISKSSRSTSRCSSYYYDCSFPSMLVAGDGDEDGYSTDSSRSSSFSSCSMSSSFASSSSSSSHCSSSSSTISACCRTVLGRDPAFGATSTCPIRLLRW